MLPPVRVNHRVLRSALSVAVPLRRTRAACQLRIKDDDPAIPSLELSTRKELFLADYDYRPTGFALGLGLQLGLG